MALNIGEPAKWVEHYRCKKCGDTHCYWCGRILVPPRRRRRNAVNNATREHLVPRSKGGGRKGGIVLACGFCNSSRGDEPDGEWIPYHLGFNEKNPNMPLSQQRAFGRIENSKKARKSAKAPRRVE